MDLFQVRALLFISLLGLSLNSFVKWIVFNLKRLNFIKKFCIVISLAGSFFHDDMNMILLMMMSMMFAASCGVANGSWLWSDMDDDDDCTVIWYINNNNDWFMVYLTASFVFVSWTELKIWTKKLVAKYFSHKVRSTRGCIGLSILTKKFQQCNQRFKIKGKLEVNDTFLNCIKIT